MVSPVNTSTDSSQAGDKDSDEVLDGTAKVAD